MIYSDELLAVAKRIFWFGTPEEALEFPLRFLTYTMTYASDEDIEILGRHFSDDWSLLRSIMTEDIVWSLPGTSLISGEASGLYAVIARAQRLVGYGLTFTLKHILIGHAQ
jgi:hypothetical protein